MDKVLDKVKVYDFFGIWGPGVVFAVYGIVSFSFVFRYDLLSYLKDFQSDFSLLIIFFICVLSYLLGTVFHEIGKLVCDRIFKQPDELIRKSESKEELVSCKRQKNDFFRGVKAYKKYREDGDKSDTPESFDVIVEKLKVANMTGVTDRYHALYGMMRGLFIGFAFMTIATGIALFFAKFSDWNIVLLAADVFLLLLFMERTYRYYLNWIRHTLSQYYLNDNIYKFTGNIQ